MASPRALVIKINRTITEFSKTVDELTKRVEALEAALEERNMAQKAMKEPPPKRRPRKKAA